MVVELMNGIEGPADTALTLAVRAALAPLTIASVWITQKLPVDIRHNSKIDRAAVSQEMSKILSGIK